MPAPLTGEQIKAIRNKTGLTQRQLGERLHVPFERIRDWEQGVHDVPDIARALFILVDIDHKRVFKALDAALGAPD